MITADNTDTNTNTVDYKRSTMYNLDRARNHMYIAATTLRERRRKKTFVSARTNTHNNTQMPSAAQCHLLAAARASLAEALASAESAMSMKRGESSSDMDRDARTDEPAGTSSSSAARGRAAPSPVGDAVDDCENEPDIRCVGAAVLDSRRLPVAALSVAGPAWRVTRERAEHLGPMVAAAAHSISARLGATGREESP